MQIFQTLLISLTLLALGVGTHSPSLDQPPLRLSLDLGGERYEAFEGRSFTVKIGDRELVALVTLGSTRCFEQAGVRFDYPQHMSLSYEEGDRHDFWMIDGLDCALYLTRFESDAVDISLRDFMGEIVESMSDAEHELTPWEANIGETERVGLQVRFALEEVDLEVALFGFGVAIGDDVFLCTLQDFPGDGENEEEVDAILELLASTFELVD